MIKPSSYSLLNHCSKFCLNSCRNVNGMINEPDCHTDKKPDGWESYQGLADHLNCTDHGPSCICANGSFFISWGVLYMVSLQHCNYLPTVNNTDSPDYDALQGGLADYCNAQGFKPGEYFMTVTGTKDTSGTLQSNGSGTLTQ